MIKRQMYIVTTLLLTMVVFTVGCGSKRPPSGGPRDSVLPEILSVTPNEFGQIGEGDLVVVFSKPIDRNTLITGLFVYPPISAKKYAWQDDQTLTVKIREPLLKDRFYYFTFTKGIRCTHSNNMKADQTFVFRSGNPQSQRISGRIDYEDPKDRGKNLVISVISADSIRIFDKTTTGDNYEITDLDRVDHRLKGYLDRNNNGRFDPTDEPSFEYPIPASEVVTRDLNVAYADSVPPRIKSVKTLWDNQFEIEYRETVGEVGDFSLFTADSLRTRIPIKAIVHDDSRTRFLTGPMRAGKHVLFAMGFSDRKGNLTRRDSVYFDAVALADSVAPTVLSTIPRTGSTVKDKRPVLTVKFSEIIPEGHVKAVFQETGTATFVDAVVPKVSSDSFALKPSKDLKPFASYDLIIKRETMDAKGNTLKKDVIVSFIVLE